MNFEIEVKSLQTRSLSLEYFLVPWDTELLDRPVAQIRHIEVHDYEAASVDIHHFSAWMEVNNIAFSTAKVSHSRLVESSLIQTLDYYFVELNYRPEIDTVSMQYETNEDFHFIEADISDEADLCFMASRTFRHTRFHLDPLLGAQIGDQRYENWMRNAFALPHQQVLKCMLGDATIAFFVQEFPEPHHAFWSLVGLTPESQGQGMGKRVWKAALVWLQENGVSKVSTSISSLNAPVLNLYARLGFRFPEPEMTFHWHRSTQRA